MLWNLGNGKFIDYTYLVRIYHQFCEGHTITAQVASRKAYFKDIGGLETVLTERDADRAFTGTTLILIYILINYILIIIFLLLRILPQLES